MNKQKLPKNWIVLNSKSHPDRIYYFNVKTKESSWDEPNADNSEQLSDDDTTRSKEPTRKRKRADKEYDPIEPDPIITEQDVLKKPNSRQKKLIAKRTLRRTEEKGKEEKETPQMKALREKLKAKEKNDLSKNNGSKYSKDVAKSPPKAIGKNKASASVPESDINAKVEVFTPQMQAIYEKMQQRASKSTSKAKQDAASTSENKKEEPKKLRRPRSQSTRSQGSAISDSSCTSKDTHDGSVETVLISPQIRKQDKREAGVTRKSVLRKRSSDSTTVETAPSKKGRKSYKKNMGKERMENLRKSLNEEVDKLESDNASTASRNSCGSSSVLNKYEALPAIYKNAEVRLVRLKDRLSKGKISLSKDVQDDQPEVLEKSSVSGTTVDDLVKQSNESSFYEEMDWEPLEDEKITFEVQAVRTQLSANSNKVLTSNVPSNTLRHPVSPVQQEKKQLYIVVDTNVFLSDVQAVELARDTTFRTYDRPTIVIPWTVIRELDYIKDDKSKTRSVTLCVKARRAVNYLNKLFSSKNSRVIGQTPEDVAKNKEKFATDCPDDEILQTCLQIRDFGKSVVLLSYDKNLCNKAMIYDVVTLGRNDPLEKIDYLNASNNETGLSCSFNEKDEERQSLGSTSIVNQELHVSNKIFDDTKSIMRDFLTVVVTKEMHTLYGEPWEKYVIIRPPWTVITVLQCAIKHWIAAVSESFLRKAEVILKTLLKIFKSFPEGGRTLKEVSYILDQCSDLIQMVNIDKHPDLMLRASEKIDELKQKCREYEVQLNERKLQDAIGTEDNVLEQERRALKAFQYFEAAYVYARDMCGLAAEAVGMPCSFHHEIPNPLPSLDEVKQVQPDLAANVNRLLHILSTIIEQADHSCLDYRTLTSLYQVLVTFLPESAPASRKLINSELAPLDIYCCVKQKKDTLKAGLRQLQELSTHFCRLASYRST